MYKAAGKKATGGGGGYVPSVPGRLESESISVQNDSKWIKMMTSGL